MLTARGFAEIGLKLFGVWLIVFGLTQGAGILTSLLYGGEVYSDHWFRLSFPNVSIVAVGIIVMIVSAPLAELLSKRFERDDAPAEDRSADFLRAALVAVGTYFVISGIVACISNFALALSTSSVQTGVRVPWTSLVDPGLRILCGLTVIVGIDRIAAVIRSLRPLKND